MAPAPAVRTGKPPPPRAGMRGRSDTRVRAPRPPRRPRTRPPEPTAGAPTHAGTCEVRFRRSPGGGRCFSPSSAPSACQSFSRSLHSRPRDPTSGAGVGAGLRRPSESPPTSPPHSPARRGKSSCLAAPNLRHLSANPGPARRSTARTQSALGRATAHARWAERGRGRVPLSMLGAVVLWRQWTAAALGSARSRTPHMSLLSELRPGPLANGAQGAHRSPSNPFFF